MSGGSREEQAPVLPGVRVLFVYKSRIAGRRGADPYGYVRHFVVARRAGVYSRRKISHGYGADACLRLRYSVATLLTRTSPPTGACVDGVFVADAGRSLPSLRERVDMPLCGNRGGRPLRDCTKGEVNALFFANIKLFAIYMAACLMIGRGRCLDDPCGIVPFPQTMRLLRFPFLKGFSVLALRRARRHSASRRSRKGVWGKPLQRLPPRVFLYSYFTKCLLIFLEVVFSNSSTRSSSAMIFLKEATRLFCSVILS